MPHLAPEALAYLSSALDTLRTYSIYRDSIDWEIFRAAVLARAHEAEEPAQTYDAIRFAVRQLGDRHSFFMTPDEAAPWYDSTLYQALTPPRGELLDGAFGYVLLPGAVVLDAARTTQYVTDVQHLIREIDTQRPCGWIVDLRGNFGGNMWAMLAGIGPILGEGLGGMAAYLDGQTDNWYYDDGKALMDTVTLAIAAGPAYTLHDPAAPVAVLTNGTTASAGEVLTVSFRDRPNTRSFGEETAGATMGNKSFKLPDGAAIALSVSLFADRTGHVYRGALVPDTLVASAPDGDPVKAAALAWLSQQTGCPQP